MLTCACTVDHTVMWFQLTPAGNYTSMTWSKIVEQYFQQCLDLMRQRIKAMGGPTQNSQGGPDKVMWYG